MKSKTLRSILVTSGALLLLSYIFILFSCKSVSSVTETSSSEKIEIVYKDSIVFRDSIIPVERYIDIVRDYDTLKLETSQAKAKCWVDSIFLKGSIENKAIVKCKYIDKWHTIVRDTTLYDQKIDTIETIKYVQRPINKATLAISIIFVLWLVLWALIHFLKKPI